MAFCPVAMTKEWRILLQSAPRRPFFSSSSQFPLLALPLHLNQKEGEFAMLDNAKKLHLALKILETLQEDDLSLADAEEILRRTLAMLQAWHSEKGGAGR
jgi:hypothetical protein